MKSPQTYAAKLLVRDLPPDTPWPVLAERLRPHIPTLRELAIDSSPAHKKNITAERMAQYLCNLTRGRAV